MLFIFKLIYKINKKKIKKKRCDHGKNFGEVSLINVDCKFEEDDVMLNNETVVETFKQAGFLLIESQEESKQLFGK